MSRIVDKRIVHPDWVYQQNTHMPKVPEYVGDEYVWLEHVIEEPGETPEDDIILVRQCCVMAYIPTLKEVSSSADYRPHYKLMEMDFCRFLRGDQRSTTEDDPVVEWRDYRELPSAY